MEQEKKVKALDRYLMPGDVWALAFGCMVGWGVFAMPGNTFLPVAGPLGTLIAMLVGMVIMMIIGRNFSYLMSRSSLTGGVYTYSKEAFGRDHAFISSWFLCLSYLTIVFLNGTALFFIVRTLFADTAHSGFHYVVAGNTIYLNETLLSVAVLAGIGILFILAKPLLQRIHTVLAFVLFAAVALIAVFCLPGAVSNGSISDFGFKGFNNGYAVFSLLILAPWAFVGFETTSFDTAHFKFPAKKTNRIIIISIAAAAFAYIAMALMSTATVPEGFSSWQDYMSSANGLTGIESVPTIYVAKTVMGTPGLVAITIGVVAAILTGIIGGYRATTRILSTMAEDRILSKKFTNTSFSIFFIMGIAIILSLLGRNTLNWFVDLTSFGAIVGFGYTSAAAYKIAKTEGNRRIAVTGIIGTLISVAFGIVQLVPRLAAMEAMGSEAFLLLAIWCLIGFLFYWRTVVHTPTSANKGMSISGVVLFALLVYSAIMWFTKQLYACETAEQTHETVTWGTVVLLALIFAGLAIMLHVQNLVRKNHNKLERERIHAVESNLAKSQFLFNMSHDIRTPMNAIIGYTNLAQKETDIGQIHDYLGKINTSSQHLLALINDILEMSRIENGKLELEHVPTDLCSVFEGMHDLFSEQMKQKNLAFNVHTGQVRNRYVWCDRKNLNRVLINVLSNAYKFTPEGGSINASIWEVSTSEAGYGSYEMRVQDNGIGMSPEFAEKIFTAFERERTSTVSKTEGTGLGMSITKSIVDLMGGTIDILTSPGSGTEIIIKLKFQLAKETDIPKAENEENKSEDAREAKIDCTNKRILIVEDNEINLEIASMILEQAGFLVDTAENGQVALDKVSASQPGYYDAILMDVQMPVMDGYEATRAIRNLENKDLADIPMLAMTANAFKEDQEASEKAGMQAHIAKPIDVSVLMNTLASVLSDAEKKD